MVTSLGSTFTYLLQNVLLAYPEIPEKYPPGVLGFELNGHRPEMQEPLMDGDVAEFVVWA